MRPGASGKTTITEAVRRTLGDYATTAAFETSVRRLDQHGGAPREDLARLAGARPVVVGDDQDKHLSGVVKLVSGGDTIAARKLYGNNVEMIPTCTDTCLLEPDARISRKDLRAALQHWGEAEGLDRLPDAIAVGA